MNSVVWLLMAACIGRMHAAPSLPPLPVNPGGIGGLFRGPNSETIIRGPDGSEIISEQIGGAVQTEDKLETIIVPDYPNDQIAVSSVDSSPTDIISVSNNIEEVSPTIQGNYVNPLQISTAPVAPIQQIQVALGEDPYIIETEVVDAAEVEPNQSSDLEGPSGSISVRGSTSIVSGPASTTISEPARKIPETQNVPLVAAPSTVLIPPALPTQVGGENGVYSNSASTGSSYITLNTNLAPPFSSNEHFTSSVPTYSSLQSVPYPNINTELIPPPIQNVQVILGGTKDSGTTSVVPQSKTLTISSTQSPEIISRGAIDLGQTIVSTSAPSPEDIDGSRINLADGYAQQNVRSSTISPLEQENRIASTISPNLSPPSNLQESPIIQPGNIYQDVAYIQNKIPGSLDSKVESTTPGLSIPPSRLQAKNPGNDLASKPWLNLNPQSFLPTEVSSQLGKSSEPISTVLDTVLVQPTDPNNREVIEFGGRKLENVGNIVPVIHHPVFLAGGLTQVHQIPTASIDQLTLRNYADIYDHNRYGRQAKEKN